VKRCPAEIRRYEVRLAEIPIADAFHWRTGEYPFAVAVVGGAVSAPAEGSRTWEIVRCPFVPDLNSLPEDPQMFFIGHDLSLLRAETDCKLPKKYRFRIFVGNPSFIAG
jgi:hypothetical protein